MEWLLWDIGFFTTTKRYAGGGPLPALTAAASGTPDEAASDPPSDGDANFPNVQAGDGATGHSSQAGNMADASSQPPVATSAVSPAVVVGTSTSTAGGMIVDSTGGVPRQVHEEPKLESSSRPTKSARIDVTSRISAVQEQHEDVVVPFDFQEVDIDLLVEDDEQLSEGHDEADMNADDADFHKLVFAYSNDEPNISFEELQHLDSIADRVEVKRLQGMGVLVGVDQLQCENLDNMKSLSTRFVRTWRPKTFSGKNVWLRRSRLVAREFAWLDERSDLFSPASNSIRSRVLQCLYLRNREAGFILGSVDVADAFLTVPQREPTKVVLKDALMQSLTFGLGKVLPGQRAGAQWWYEAITDLLCRELNMKQCPAYPNLMSTEDQKCVILLHVDDMLVCGHGGFVHSKLIPTLERFHKISSEFLKDVGDEIIFLKRSHKLLEGNMLAISPHHKHVDQLMRITGIRQTSRPKSTPGHPLLDEVDETGLLDEKESSDFRSCVGILLYLSNDIPHCQHVIRHLSTGMSKPTTRMKDILRHLVSYLYGTRTVCLVLNFKGDSIGIHHAYHEIDNVLHLECFSDSDWASNTKTRRSISSGYLCWGSALLYSSSRTQRVVALSSGEAEVYASSSAACDAVLLARILNFITGCEVLILHLLDSSAARGILRRQGVGRIRHLSCRILWLQQLIKDRRDFCAKDSDATLPIMAHEVSAVSGLKNIADLGTKRLGKKRLIELMSFCNLGILDNGDFIPFEVPLDIPTSESMISLVKAVKTCKSSRHVDLALTIARIVMLESALSPSPTMAMNGDCMGSQYPCGAGIYAGGIQHGVVNYVGDLFPWIFTGIFMFMIFCWIFFTWAWSNSGGMFGVKMKFCRLCLFLPGERCERTSRAKKKETEFLFFN